VFAHAQVHRGDTQRDRLYSAWLTVGRSGTAATDAQMRAEMLAYSQSRGLFAGIDLSGGSVRPDTDAIMRAYGPSARALHVVNGTQSVTVPPTAQAFVAALSRPTGPAHR